MYCPKNPLYSALLCLVTQSCLTLSDPSFALLFIFLSLQPWRPLVFFAFPTVIPKCRIIGIIQCIVFFIGFTFSNIHVSSLYDFSCFDNIPLPDCTAAAAATAKRLQSCPTLCDPIDGSLPGSSIHGILQVRVLECGAIAFSGLNALQFIYSFIYRRVPWLLSLLL